MITIKYPYPVEGVSDLSARLYLGASAVGAAQTMAAYQINSIHAGYSTDFLTPVDGDADRVQISSVSEDFAVEYSLDGYSQKQLLEAIAAGGSGGGGAGDGAYAVEQTVLSGGTALQNATVRLSEGINTFAVPTDVNGKANFSLDAATYKRTITKDGYSFTPDTVVVDGVESFSATMTQIVYPVPGTTYIAVLVDLKKMGVNFTPELEGLPITMTAKPTEGQVVDDEFAIPGGDTILADENGRATFDIAGGVTWECSVEIGTKKRILYTFFLPENLTSINLAEYKESQ